MSSGTCSCSRPIHDHAVICRVCGQDTARVLGEIPWLDRECKVTAAGGARLGGGNGGRRSSDTPLPCRPDATALVHRTRVRITHWALLVAEHAGIDLRVVLPGPVCPACTHVSCVTIRAATTWSTAHLSRWLGVHVDGLRRIPDAAAAAADIARLADELERKINRPMPRWFAGPCGDCGADLWVRPGAQAVVCGTIGCGREYDVARRRDELLERVRDQLAPAETIAAAVGAWLSIELPVTRVYGWRNRGRLEPRGLSRPRLTYDADGRRRTRPVQLFRLGDVLALVEESQVNAARRNRGKAA